LENNINRENRQSNPCLCVCFVFPKGLAYVLLVAMTGFFSRISDSRFGGTYMTLLNTMVNLGLAWSSSLGLKMMDFLTFKKCSNNPQNDCSTTDSKNVRLRYNNNILG